MIKLNRPMLCLCLLGILTLSSTTDVWAQDSTQSAVKIEIRTDREDAVYQVNDPVIFAIVVTEEGKPVVKGTLDWSLSYDGVAPIEKGTLPIKEGRATVSGRLASPGFLQCKISYKHGQGTSRGLAAAAVDPLAIKPSLPIPEDFDRFWEAKKAELAKIPLQPVLTPVPTKESNIEVFKVEAPALETRPMSGLYARPAGAKPKSCPAVITLEGAGVYGTRQEPWLLNLAKAGFLSLELNAHGIPSLLPDGFYHELEKGGLKDYQISGRESRDRFYFLSMYLRDLQGVNFLAAQPEWDGRVLIANGGSQGAAQSIFVAAEDPRVTALVATVPAMCDHSGMLAGRVAGWPKLIPSGNEGQPDPDILQTSRYFDSVNFASKIRVPSLFIVGFIDQVTPPTSVFAAYNNVPGKKEIMHVIQSGHTAGKEKIEETTRWILAHRDRLSVGN